MGRRGFTIVELLIVIVVIAILAAISVAAYSSVQSRTKDSVRRSDLAQIAKAMKLRAVNYTTPVRSGDACGLEPDGFFSQAGVSMTGSNYGAKSAAQCLAEESNTTAIYRDPSGATSCATGNPGACYAYFFASCANGTYVYAHLQTVNVSTTATDNTCGSAWDFDELWGMNYYVKAL
jgi:prepilin-type N-terminal cleavage/methylation domain-containing protein